MIQLRYTLFQFFHSVKETKDEFWICFSVWGFGGWDQYCRWKLLLQSWQNLKANLSTLRIFWRQTNVLHQRTFIFILNQGLIIRPPLHDFFLWSKNNFHLIHFDDTLVWIEQWPISEASFYQDIINRSPTEAICCDFILLTQIKKRDKKGNVDLFRFSSSFYTPLLNKLLCVTSAVGQL